MADKTLRQRRVRELLLHETVHNQDQLQSLLAREGIHATQATLSRDLRDIGVLKGADGYALPGDTPPQPPGAALQRALHDYLVDATQASNLVVLKTGPGHAQALALELDRARPQQVIGTVAGDDTIFVATPSLAAAFEVLGELLTLAGRASPKPRPHSRPSHTSRTRRRKIGSHA